MEQDRLNNCLLLNCNKSITATLNTADIAKEVFYANEQRKKNKINFVYYAQIYALGMRPHVSKRYAVSFIPGLKIHLDDLFNTVN